MSHTLAMSLVFSFAHFLCHILALLETERPVGSVFHCNFFVNYISWEERVEEIGSQTLRAVCVLVHSCVFNGGGGGGYDC